MFEVHQVIPAHRSATLGEFVYAYTRIQDRDFLISHRSETFFSLLFPAKEVDTGIRVSAVPVRIKVQHKLGVEVATLPPSTLRTITDLVRQDVGRHLGLALPERTTCVCVLDGRSCWSSEFIVAGAISG